MRFYAIAAAVFALFVGGCATQSQKQYQTMDSQIKGAFQEAGTCWERIKQTPEGRIVGQILLNRPNDPNRIQKLANQRYVTENEIETILKLAKMESPCRNVLTEKLGAIHPSLVDVYAASFAETDEEIVALINHEITIGEKNKRKSKRETKYQREFQRIMQQITSQLNQSHQAELQQRERAGQNLQNWAYQQQLLLNYQQQQQQANRPLSMRCYPNGNAVTCTEQ